MKLVTYILIAFLAVQMVGCKPTTEKKTETTEISQPAKLETASVNIKGMTCEIGCAKTIESKISKLEGVTESKVNFEEEKGTFTYDSNKTSEEKIIKTINDLLDGKTYKATHAETANKSCSKECAEKCDHKEGEACAKKCDKAAKKDCNADCKKACEEKKNKECKTEGKKPCCADKK